MASYQDPTQIFVEARLMFLMFLFDIIFMLFALHHWPPLNMCPTRQNTLCSYLTGWVKILNNLVTYISCNTYFIDTLRDIKSFKTNLPIIFKSLTSSISNLFKAIEHPFHILVLSFSFYLFNGGTWNMLKYSDWCCQLWLCWNSCEWLCVVTIRTCYN